MYKSAFDLSDGVRNNWQETASQMVPWLAADLKPGVSDAPLRGCGA